MRTPSSPPSAGTGLHPAAAAPPRRPGLGRLAAALLVLLASVALAWVGGFAGAAGALAAGLLLPWLGQRPQHGMPVDSADRRIGGRAGAEVMVAQVVPVWRKQLDATRHAASTGLSTLLGSFSGMAGALDTLGRRLDSITPPATPDTANPPAPAADPQARALATLLAPSQRAFAQRDAAVDELIRCAEQLEALRQLGRQAREIGKHTRLVAFNASIEANRSGAGQQSRGSGAAAVADETRTLAGRMAEVGDKIEQLVAKLDRTLSNQRLRGEIDDTTSDELRLELDLRAREALGGLLGALGGAQQSAGDIKAASQALRTQVDALLVHFQFGDRLSQMLDTVDHDMQHFVRWVAANPYASQSDAADWLAKLECTYTMDAQRASHHGTVHIERGHAVDVF